MAHSHYEVLGVLPSASQDEIRVAYRMRAREVHPDTAEGQRSNASEQMATIAEAWRVLSDSKLRKMYDDERKGLHAEPLRETQNYVQYVPVARGVFPWRMIGFMVAGVIGLMLVLNLLSGPAVPVAPDGLLQAGSCVEVDTNQLAVEVDCGGKHSFVVRTLVGFDMTCPSDTRPFRDRQGMGIACVVTG
jgi:molecular chaperone DnaJ